MADDRDTTKPFLKTDKGGLKIVCAFLIMGGVALTVFREIPLLVSTVGAVITGGRVEQNIWDIAFAVFLTANMVMVACAYGVHKLGRPLASRATREEDLEERRAWMADLREQSAPRHERLAQWLSLTFVATPIMAVRRSLRPAEGPVTPRARVGALTVSMAIATVLDHDLYGTLGTAVALAVILVTGRLVGWFVTSPARRARAVALVPGRRRIKQ
jgi:hypothetical protein